MKRIWLIIVCGWCFAAPLAAQTSDIRPISGLRTQLPHVHALVGAQIVASADRQWERGTIVVRDGIIEQIGAEADVKIPADARRWDLAGRTIYPGLVESYSELTLQDLPAETGSAHWSQEVQPQRTVESAWKVDEGVQDAMRKQGIVVRLVAPSTGILKGQSAVVDSGSAENEHQILASSFALHMRLTVSRGSEGFPASPMGAVALARQTFYDAQWYRDAWNVMASRQQAGLVPPDRNAALEALTPFLDGQRPVIFDALDEQFLLRADQFAREFGLQAWMLGSGHEYERLAEIRAIDRPLILPIAFPKPPNVETPESAREVSLERLMHWDLAPENPARLHAAGVRFALTSYGQKKPEEFWPAVRKAVRRGLPESAALRALTETPAEWLGLRRQVGTLEKGKFAHLMITRGDLFTSDESKIVEVWVHGRRYELEASSPLDVRGRWTIDSGDGVTRPFLQLSGEPLALTGELVAQTPSAPKETEASQAESDETKVALRNLNWSQRQLTANFPGSSWGLSGTIRLTLTFLAGEERADDRWIGEVVLPDGLTTSVTVLRHSESGQEAGAKETPETTVGAQDTVKAEPTPAKSESTASDAKQSEGMATATTTGEMASYPVNYPLGDFGQAELPAQAEWVLFRQARVWTCGPEGVLPEADVLVHRGLIERVVQTLPAAEWPEGVVVVEAKGMHLTPGIIDCHSHMATDGGVNEATQAITAEVRVGDFIDGHDVTIYRQLAGGVTAANILHGSANPIGGQNQVIKLRWGATSDEMKFREAPAGIKFALGENVKQSYRSNSNRYPQSRMGVEQLIRDAMLGARQYRDRQLKWKERREGLPPRRDLEMDALVEILEGKRWIHCHSYRQDEILALLRTMESLGVQVGTLQHILEGYKVADAIKQHGAMASSFADWWAYKMEVYDAIPFNGALMHQQGVVVSFNSDDGELARHLNQEAGKAMKYGGVSAEEALRFVTLNPAKQLRIDQWVGSIEVGKQADLVLWSDEPLSPFARCQQTWIDGRNYFNFEEDRARRPQWESMRATLIQKILNGGESPAKAGEEEPQHRDQWLRYDEYCPMSRP